MIALALALAGATPVRALDTFDTVAAWHASASDGVSSRVSENDGALNY